LPYHASLSDIVQLVRARGTPLLTPRPATKYTFTSSRTSCTETHTTYTCRTGAWPFSCRITYCCYWYAYRIVPGSMGGNHHLPSHTRVPTPSSFKTQKAHIIFNSKVSVICLQGHRSRGSRASPLVNSNPTLTPSLASIPSSISPVTHSARSQNRPVSAFWCWSCLKVLLSG
jgi:hypothetical protein